MDTPVARSRRPAVAGYYYPADPQRLTLELARCVGATSPEAALGLIVPHDSYRRSGSVAGAVFGRVTVPRRCVVVGPSQTPHPAPWRLMCHGAYRTPFGEMPIDEGLARAWQLRCPWLTTDPTGHLGEHAIEVQVPFLQRCGPEDVMLVPLIIGCEDRTRLAATARGLAQAVRLVEEPVLLMASSVLSQYEPDAKTRAQDAILLQALSALDGAAFLDAVRDQRAVVSGDTAIALILDAARALGAQRASCVAYATSAEAGGDPEAAVGYAGVLLQ